MSVHNETRKKNAKIGQLKIICLHRINFFIEFLLKIKILFVQRKPIPIFHFLICSSTAAYKLIRRSSFGAGIKSSAAALTAVLKQKRKAVKERVGKGQEQKKPVHVYDAVRASP